jgi:DNA-binding MarR family transcriptional regulator
MAKMPPKSPKKKDVLPPDAGSWMEPGPNAEQIMSTDSPSYLILKLSTVLSRRFNREFVEQVGVGIPEVRLIGVLYDYEPLKFKQIIWYSMMDKAQASRTLAALIRGGYISLHGPDGPAKRFTARVAAKLTQKGRNEFKKILVIARRHQLEILNQLSREERKSFHDILHHLLGWAEREYRG